jgi:acetyl-CoA acetyltransferase
MALEQAYIPYGLWWSTPFCRWQGGLGREHSMKLAAASAASVLARKEVAPSVLDGLVLGITVPQKGGFYGAPWLAGMLGAPEITGPTISQACATSVALLASASRAIESGAHNCMLAVACDRTSNGPHFYYPDPAGMGGTGEAENPVLDNFSKDPWAKNAMIETAEKVAAAEGITREEQDEVALLRFQQYQESLADERSFQKRYMTGVEIKKGKKTSLVEEDEGIFPTTAEGLAGLRPVLEGGTVTFGSQTHPADGNAGIVVCAPEIVPKLAPNTNVSVRVLGFGEAREEKGFMPRAVVPAARKALAFCGLGIEDCEAVKTHNPFAVNDVYFCRETGVAAEKLNRYGSPLVYGHPQAPTGLRAIIELIEELAERGGGRGLFSGCAAGDTAMALVVEVSG